MNKPLVPGSDALTELEAERSAIREESGVRAPTIGVEPPEEEGPPDDDDFGPTDYDDPGRYTQRLTGLGNAEYFMARHGQDLRYCHPWKKWFVWTGAHWQKDDTAEIQRRAQESVRAMYADAAKIADERKRRGLASHALNCEGERELNEMIRLGSTQLGVPILPADMDRDPWILPARNGTIDLRTGQLREHRREDFCTRSLGLVYKHEAKCPRWEQFLVEILAGDAELVAFLWRAIGYSLTGLTIEQVLFFAHGGGSNGKTTLLLVLRWLLGEYAAQCAPDLLLAKKGEVHPTEQAALFGKRLAICTEIEKGRRLAEVTVKQLTGSDAITARRMKEDFWTFEPTHKFWIGANDKPIISGTDHAIWRRLHLIPFDVKFGDDRKDPELPERLRAELPGILAWAVRGCLEWQRVGLQPPARVLAATETYRSESDCLGQWIAGSLVQDRRHETPAKTLYEHYQAWSEGMGDRPMSQRAFGLALSERGYERVKRGVFRYRGVRLRSPDDQDELDDADLIQVSGRNTRAELSNPDPSPQGPDGPGEQSELWRGENFTC